MARRSTRIVPRSPREWRARILLAIVAGTIGFGATTHSLALTLRANAPSRAFALAPYDGRLTAAHAASLVKPQADEKTRSTAEHLARMALRQDATALPALRALGTNAQIRGDTLSARQYFKISDRMSRRDLGTRLWLIEDAVARDDVSGALDHYNIALTTSRGAAGLLIPILVSAITDEAIAKELVDTLSQKPVWTQTFLYEVAKDADPAAAARLFERLTSVSIVPYDGYRTSVVNRLFGLGEYQAAWTFYASFRDDADLRGSRDPRFAKSISEPAVFDWKLLGGVSGISTSMQFDGDVGSLNFSAPSGIGGALIEQFQILPEGPYSIKGKGVFGGNDTSGIIDLVITCDRNKEIGRLSLNRSSTISESNFFVPENCPTQRFYAVLRPVGSFSGIEGRLDMAEINSH